MRKTSLFFLILLTFSFPHQSLFGSTLDDGLFEAMKNNDLEEVKYLVEKGANIKTQDQSGKTPLDMATGEVREYLKSLVNTNGHAK